MTKNQIDYQSLVETRRANRAREQQAALDYEENKRKNLAGESLTASAQAETGRHNRVVEEETNRSNLVNEAQGAQKLVIENNKLIEQQRSNRANESIKAGNLAELQRHDIAQENISNYGNVIAGMNAATNQMNSRVNYGNYILETKKLPYVLNQIESNSSLNEQRRSESQSKQALNNSQAALVDANIGKVGHEEQELDSRTGKNKAEANKANFSIFNDLIHNMMQGAEHSFNLLNSGRDYAVIKH